jgi:hypothetical protein
MLSGLARVIQAHRARRPLTFLDVTPVPSLGILDTHEAKLADSNAHEIVVRSKEEMVRAVPPVFCSASGYSAILFASRARR